MARFMFALACAMFVGMVASCSPYTCNAIGTTCDTTSKLCNGGSFCNTYLSGPNLCQARGGAGTINCHYDTDCLGWCDTSAATNVCKDTVADNAACTKSTQCGPTSVCLSNVCKPLHSAILGDSCTSDNDCILGQYCYGSTCAAWLTEGQGCTSLTKCMPNLACNFFGSSVCTNITSLAFGANCQLYTSPQTSLLCSLGFVCGRSYTCTNATSPAGFSTTACTVDSDCPEDSRCSCTKAGVSLCRAIPPSSTAALNAIVDVMTCAYLHKNSVYDPACSALYVSAVDLLYSGSDILPEYIFCPTSAATGASIFAILSILSAAIHFLF